MEHSPLLKHRWASVERCSRIVPPERASNILTPAAPPYNGPPGLPRASD